MPPTACSSMVEHILYTDGVAGSSPAPREWVVQAVEHRESHQPLSLLRLNRALLLHSASLRQGMRSALHRYRWFESSLPFRQRVNILVTVAPFWRLQVELHPF